jgi:L-aminopeptidase/D-esterase-like protein
VEELVRPPHLLDVVEDVAQAIVNALFAAETVTGFAGHTRTALAAVLPDWRELLQ